MKLTDIVPYSEMGAAIKHVYLEFVGANAANVSGRSNKFWEGAFFERSGEFIFVVRYGPYGKRGTIKEKLYHSRKAARQVFEKKRSEKWDKGYQREVDVVTRLGILVEEEHV